LLRREVIVEGIHMGVTQQRGIGKKTPIHTIITIDTVMVGWQVREHVSDAITTIDTEQPITIT
jgi:hypothetical protein